MVMFQERPLARLCALNPDTPGTNSVCREFSLWCSYPSCWPPEAT